MNKPVVSGAIFVGLAYALAIEAVASLFIVLLLRVMA